MSEVTGLYPPNPVVTVTTGGVPGRPGVVTPPLSEIHADTIVARDDAQTAAGEAVLSASSAATARSGAETAAATATQKATAAASSATAAATSASNAASSATAAASSATAAASSAASINWAGLPGKPAVIAAGATAAAARTAIGAADVEAVAFKDTGWRNLSGAFINGWTGTTMRIRRIGNLVHFMIHNLNGAAATATRFAELPAGFKPDFTNAVLPIAPSGMVTITPTHFITTPAPSIAGEANSYLQWPCSGTWPTTLPGTPA